MLKRFVVLFFLPSCCVNLLLSKLLCLFCALIAIKCYDECKTLIVSSFFNSFCWLLFYLSQCLVVLLFFVLFVEFFTSAACGTKVRECGTPTALACMQKCSNCYMFIVPPFQSTVIYSVVLFMKSNYYIDFKILSLNVRGIHSFEKRKVIFNWLT